jgi:hypothetical protein
MTLVKSFICLFIHTKVLVRKVSTGFRRKRADSETKPCLSKELTFF